MKWTQQKEKAAQLLAQGGPSAREVAKAVGCNKGTIALWRRDPDFQARIDHHVEEFGKTFSEITAKICRARAQARLKLLEKIASIVDEITPEELQILKKSPASAISLLIRLEQTVEAAIPRKTKTNEEQTDEDFPFHQDLSPEMAQRVVDLLQSGRPSQGTGPDPTP